MDCYEILGVDKDSSIEELKKAYEKKVSKIETEVSNKKNADAFLKVLEEAYKDALFQVTTTSKEKGQAFGDTVMFTDDELNEIRSDYYDEDLCYDEEPYDEDIYEEEKRSNRKRKRRHSNSNAKRKKGNKEKDRDKDKIDNKKNLKKGEEENRTKKESNILLLPFKIIVFPIIIILSIIIFILKFIDAIIWIATKILLIASIAGASIYGYEVYCGRIYMDIRVFIICGGIFILSVILPYITGSVPNLLSGINNSLKNFIFN